MSLTMRMLASWRRPREVMRGILSSGPREDRALVTLMVACAMMFAAQWPNAARLAHFDPSVPLEGRISAAMMSSLFILPLAAYAFAAIVHIVLKLFGGKGSFYTSRMALFWAMLVTSPLMLLQGLLTGFIGTGTQATVIGLMIFVAFLYHWINALIVAEGREAVAE